MAFSLDRVLKALLFGASGPLDIKEIQRVFTKFHEQREPEPEEELTEDEVDPAPEQPFLEAEGMPTSDVPSLVTSTQIREAADRIAANLEENDEVFRIEERHNGYILVTSSTMGEWIRLLRDEPRPMKLSQSALETLAVVAYRQPVVRSEIEKIRGVSVDSGISRLLEREFIEVVGRADLPGRPIQYGTTEAFLEFVGARTVEELPASDVLSPRQIDEWLTEVSNQKEPTETEMGLPEGERPESEAGETPEEATKDGEDAVSPDLEVDSGEDLVAEESGVVVDDDAAELEEEAEEEGEADSEPFDETQGLRDDAGDEFESGENEKEPQA